MNKLELNAKTGLLQPVIHCPSSHYDERPHDMAIDTLVIHGISLPEGQFNNDYVERFFCGKLDFDSHPSFAAIASLKVAAHLLIKRNGDIIQFVSFLKRAWHAGQSCFMNRTNFNDFSIGIELEGTDYIPYEKVQYKNLLEVIKILIKTYPEISKDKIVGHADIAPDRKTDPGPVFDWDYLKGSLA